MTANETTLKMFTNGNGWLNRSYPTLEHFGISTYSSKNEESYSCTALLNFLECNPNIRVLFVNSHFLLMNRHLLLESNLKFDRFHIFVSRNHDLNVVRDAVNALYQRDFYKQLKLTWVYPEVDGQAHHLSTFHSLAKLDVRLATFVWPADLVANLKCVKELKICVFLLYLHNNQVFDSNFVTSNLNDLECISVHDPGFQDISSLVRYAPKLREIRVTWGNLSQKRLASEWIALNDERKKLNGASKITIFIPELDYLKVKWTSKTKFSLVELKREESHAKDQELF